MRSLCWPVGRSSQRFCQCWDCEVGAVGGFAGGCQFAGKLKRFNVKASQCIRSAHQPAYKQ